MKFYYSPGSCALASHITLAEAGADYEPIRIDFGKAEQREAAYLSVNPKGRVPALVTDDGILTETPAILVYLAQCFPSAGLAPLDRPFQFARVQAFNSYLCSTVHVAHAHKGRGYRWADTQEAVDEMKRKVPETVGACFDLIENDYVEGPWVMGDTYTICDPYLYTLSCWLEGDGIDRARYPKVEAQAQKMLQRPAVKRALDEHFG